MDASLRLPCTLGQDPGSDEDVHHRDRGDVSEESPVCDVIGDPWQNGASDSKVHTKSDVNNQRSSVHGHVLDHC